MGKPPAFQFYAKDWISSKERRLMTLEQRGLYIDMLCEAWDSDPPGTLPNDHGRIATLLGVPLKRFQSIAGLVLEQFKVEGDVLVNERLRAEREKQEGFAERQSKRGAAGADARWRKDSGKNGTSISPPLAQAQRENGFASAVCILQSESANPPEDGSISIIALAHPKLSQLKAHEIPQSVEVAIIEAVASEVDKQGSVQKAAEFVLRETKRAVAEHMADSERKFISAPEKFFRFREYRVVNQKPAGPHNPGIVLADPLENCFRFECRVRFKLGDGKGTDGMYCSEKCEEIYESRKAVKI